MVAVFELIYYLKKASNQKQDKLTKFNISSDSH